MHLDQKAHESWLTILYISVSIFRIKLFDCLFWEPNKEITLLKYSGLCLPSLEKLKGHFRDIEFMIPQVSVTLFKYKFIGFMKKSVINVKNPIYV